MDSCFPCLRWCASALVCVLAYIPMGGFAQSPAALSANSDATTTRPVLSIAIGRGQPMDEAESSGYLSPVLDELFSRSGMDYVLLETPGARGMDEANSGRRDAVILPVPIAGSRFPDLLTLPESLLPIELAGLYTRDDIFISSVDDFFDYRLAYIRGWKKAGSLFRNHEHVELVRKPSVLMKMLANDRVDVVFYATFPGNLIARQIGLRDLKVSEFYVTTHLYLHLNKRHASLLPVLEKQLAAMKVDGSLDSILADYGVGRTR